MTRISRILGFMVTLVALGFAVNALAYRYASVDSKLSFTVANTSASALAFEAATSTDPGLAVSFASNQMSITINDHIQPGSKYKWANAFKITNKGYWNGTAYVPYDSVTLGWSNATLPTGVTLKLVQAGSGLDLGTDIKLITLNNSTLPSVTVDIQLDVAEGASTGSVGPLLLTITGSR